MIDFYVNQKVVCIKSFKRKFNFDVLPVKDEIYTIREIIMYEFLYLRLHELVNPVKVWRNGHAEAAWAACNFKPLLMKPTDIGFFTAMLNTTKNPELVD